MFNFFQNFAKEMVTKPEKTSRAVVASILIIGMVALTLNLGETIAPQYFAGNTLRIVTPLTTENLTAQVEKTDAEVDAAVLTCKSNRLTKQAEVFLKSFEDSFNGILPGAGDLLREHAGMVSGRRDALVLEVMRNYANLKFCIDDSAVFRKIHDQGYSEMLGSDLNVYIKVLSAEASTNQNNRGRFLTAAMTDYSSAAEDLAETEDYVKQTIDDAVEAAKDADQQTNDKINSLATQTGNNLSDRSMTLDQNNKSQTNQLIQVSGQQSEQLDKIIQLLSYAYSGPIPDSKKIYFEGSNRPNILKWRNGSSDDYFENPAAVVADEGETVEVALPEATGLQDIVDQAQKEINKSADGGLFSYGILNLVDEFVKADFLAFGFKEAVLNYIAAKNNFDPNAPRSGFAKGAETLPYPNTALINNQLCSSIDTPNAACFGYTIRSSAATGNTSTSNSARS